MLSNFLPKNKSVRLFLWSGDARPFEKALAMCNIYNLRNLNGGGGRFDRNYPSYGWLSPLARQVGRFRQIYACSDSDKSYNEYIKAAHGFRYLRRTLYNTDVPLRIKAMDIYYHMYSAREQATLDALTANLEYADFQEICPVRASEYCNIVNGFYSCEFEKLAPDCYRVLTRGRLQTVRFDRSVLKKVDFSKSQGLVGQRHFHGSLYVYLDRDCPAARITLKNNPSPWRNPDSPLPYLIRSRWQISGFDCGRQSFSFDVNGYGNGQMLWFVPRDGEYEVLLDGRAFIFQARNNLLEINIPNRSGISAVHVSVTRNLPDEDET